MDALGKILAGAQAGAEFSLPEGQYVLGSGDEADLVFVDVAVRPRHAILTVAGDGWRVKPIDGAELWVDGTPVTESDTVAPFAVVSLGGTHFALGPDGPWPALPAIPALSAAGDAATADEPEDVTLARENASPSESAAGSPAGSVARREKARRSIFALCLLLAVILAASLFWGGYSLYTGYWSPVSGLAVENALRAEGFRTLYPSPKNARELSLGMIGLAMDGNGAVTLSGLVRDDAEKRRAMGVRALSDRIVTDELKTVAGSIRTAAAAVRAAFPDVSLTQPDEGYGSILGGFVHSEEEAAESYRLARKHLDTRIVIRRSVQVREKERGGEGFFAGVPAAAPEEQAAPAPAAEPAEQAELSEPSAPPAEWKIVTLTSAGFIDQDARLHEKGEYLSSSVLIIDSWPEGVVFQRGEETLFSGPGSIIQDSRTRGK